MSAPFRAAAAPASIDLDPAEIALLVDALGIAIDHYTAKAEARRKLTETALTITQRRRASAEAMDLTARARKLDAFRRSLNA